MRGTLFPTTLALALPWSLAHAQAVTMDRESLEAVPGVFVIVEGVTPAAGADGLTAESLRADIEALLRQAGIPVLSEPQWQQLIGNPALELRLQLLKPSPHFYLYSGSLQLKQLTVLLRDSTKAAFAPTWEAAELLGTKPTGRLATLRDEVRPLVGRFITEYREAMARRGAAPEPAPRRRATVVVAL